MPVADALPMASLLAPSTVPTVSAWALVNQPPGVAADGAGEGAHLAGVAEGEVFHRRHAQRTGGDDGGNGTAAFSVIAPLPDEPIDHRGAGIHELVRLQVAGGGGAVGRGAARVTLPLLVVTPLVLPRACCCGCPR